MKKNSSISNLCKQAAIRIQYWLKRDKETFLSSSPHEMKTKNFAEAYKCDLLRSPRVPSPTQPRREAKVKKRLITKDSSSSSILFCMEQAHYSVNQKYPHLVIKNVPLSSERVANWRIMEHSIVCKQLKLLSNEKNSGPKNHDVVVIDSSLKNEKNSEALYLEEWRHIRQDREFPVAHITN